MAGIFTSYILPFLMLCIVLGSVYMKIRNGGGPAGMVLRFFIVAFGPSLVYALVADESGSALFGISLMAALISEGVLFLLFGGGIRRPGDAEGENDTPPER